MWSATTRQSRTSLSRRSHSHLKWRHRKNKAIRSQDEETGGDMRRGGFIGCTHISLFWSWKTFFGGETSLHNWISWFWSSRAITEFLNKVLYFEGVFPSFHFSKVFCHFIYSEMNPLFYWNERRIFFLIFFKNVLFIINPAQFENCQIKKVKLNNNSTIFIVSQLLTIYRCS